MSRHTLLLLGMFTIAAAGGTAGLPSSVSLGSQPSLLDKPAVPPTVRIDNLSVQPSSLPPVVVHVTNPGETAVEAVVVPTMPEGWTIEPAEQPITVAPGESASVSFMTKKGRTVPENEYEVAVELREPSGVTTQHQQVIRTASAPYFKPTIDGQTDDWADAIPVTFEAGGKATTIETFWNRRSFSLLVRVEEDKLTTSDGLPPGPKAGKFDGVQLAIADRDAQTPTDEVTPFGRFELLLLPNVDGATGTCYLLTKPGDLPSQPAEIVVEETVDVAISRDEDRSETVYECSIPFRLLDTIRPSEGRPFQMSVLVHDVDGTGLRDWGRAAGLTEIPKHAWRQVPGGTWDAQQPPTDSKTAWGMCSSKY